MYRWCSAAQHNDFCTSSCIVLHNSQRRGRRWQHKFCTSHKAERRGSRRRGVETFFLLLLSCRVGAAASTSPPPALSPFLHTHCSRHLTHRSSCYYSNPAFLSSPHLLAPSTTPPRPVSSSRPSPSLSRVNPRGIVTALDRGVVELVKTEAESDDPVCKARHVRNR